MMQICDDKHCNIVYKIQLMNAIKKWLHVWNLVDYWIISSTFFPGCYSHVWIMVSHITITWHCSDMLVYMTVIFINKSCDLRVFRRLRNLPVIILQRTHSGSPTSAAPGPNRMGPENVSRWPRGSKWSPGGAFSQQVSSWYRMGTQVIFITPAAAESSDYLISRWIGRWSLPSGAWVGSRTLRG